MKICAALVLDALVLVWCASCLAKLLLLVSVEEVCKFFELLDLSSLIPSPHEGASSQCLRAGITTVLDRPDAALRCCLHYHSTYRLTIHSTCRSTIHLHYKDYTLRSSDFVAIVTSARVLRLRALQLHTHSCHRVDLFTFCVRYSCFAQSFGL